MFKPSKVEWINDTKIITWVNNKKIISNKILNLERGQLQLKISFVKKGRIPITVFGYSLIEDLRTKKGYNRAKRVAFKSAYKEVPFSPDDYDIIGEKYFYVIPIEEKVLIKSSIYR